MTYRDDLDALTARQASLQAELGRRQRELAEVTEMLAEAGRAGPAERGLEPTPDLRRSPRRHLMIGTLAITLGSSAGVGAAVTTVDEAPRAAAVEPGVLVRVRSVQASRDQAQRKQAELEALRALSLIAAAAPDAPPKWRLGPPRWSHPEPPRPPEWLPSAPRARHGFDVRIHAARAALPEAPSAAGEDQR